MHIFGEIIQGKYAKYSMTDRNNQNYPDPDLDSDK